MPINCLSVFDQFVGLALKGDYFYQFFGTIFSWLSREFFRPYDTKLKVRGLKFKRASVSELKTELGSGGLTKNVVLKKLPD